MNPASDESLSKDRQLEDLQMVAIGQVCGLIGVSPKTLRAWVARRAFPAPLRPGGVDGQPGKVARWSLATIREWVESDAGLWTDPVEDDVPDVTMSFDPPGEDFTNLPEWSPD